MPDVSIPNPTNTFITEPPVDEEMVNMEKKDQQIKALSEDPGWLKVREIFDSNIKRLENAQAVLTEGKDDAEVARGLRVNVEAARVLRGVLAEVDQHAEPEQ